MKHRQKKLPKADLDVADFDVSSDTDETIEYFEKFATCESRPQHIPNLDLLQTACETLATRARRRIEHLRCVLDGSRIPVWCLPLTSNLDGADPGSNSNDSALLTSTQPSSTASSVSERIAKTVPGKPLTLIISQRSSKHAEDDERPAAKRSRLSSNTEAPAGNHDGMNGFAGPLITETRRAASTAAVGNAPLRPWRKSGLGGPGGPGGPQTRLELRQTRENSVEVGDKSSPSKNLYDIPNKFWALMEPYCADLTEDNLRALERMIKRYEDDSNLYKVPPLGEDVGGSVRQWAAPEESVSVDIKSEPKSKSAHETDLTALLKRVDTEMRKPVSEPSQLSNVAQHMVSNLIEQNVMRPMCAMLEKQEDTSDDPASSPDRKFALPTKSLARQLKVSNSFKLEKKIKKHMEKLGHFPMTGRSEDDDEGLDDDPSDEVLAVLRRKQREFRLLSEYNRSVLRRVALCVRRDLQRQEILRRLAIADADVMEAYNKIISYRQKCKPPSKRDRDLAWKTLRERRKLLKELEEFNAVS